MQKKYTNKRKRGIEMKNTRTNKGITLIALVITIIVLLILAAVSIATLTGENGVLTKADIARKKNRHRRDKRTNKNRDNGNFR